MQVFKILAVTCIWLSIRFTSSSQVTYSCALNTLQSIQGGSATITTSTLDIGNVAAIFDGNDGTLARSANINPLVVTVSFINTVNITNVRVIQSYGEGWFTLEAANTLADLNGQSGSYQLLLQQVPTINGVPVGGAVSMPVSTSRKIFRLTVRKTVGDNFVHLNEWTLTGTVNNEVESIVSSPATINLHPGWEIWLNNPNATQSPVISGVIGATNIAVNPQCINWSVSDPAILQINTVSGKLKAITAGTANLTATVGGVPITIPVFVTRLQSVGQPDLSVRYIKRLPEIDYVQNSTNPAVQGWPAVGQSITWRVYVRNWSANSYNNVSYQWKRNGTVINSGTTSFTADEEKMLQINDTWAFQRDSIEFTIDNLNAISEFSEINNSLEIYTNAISANFYVEQTLYDYFHINQNKLGVGANSWDDWAQVLHVKRWNLMLQNAVSSDAPNGVIDRIRIDSIVIVPDNTLPLAGGVPSNNPNVNDRTVDLQWGFETGLLSGPFASFYSNHTSTVDANPFFYEGSLLHELGHARYLIDTYGMDIDTAFVKIREGNVDIVGTPLMPIIAWNIVYYNINGGLMGGPHSGISPYEAMALNLIANRRALCGNMNSPCNIGIYINDLPDNNHITLKDQNNNPLANACVEIYRAVANNSSWYGKHFDDIPDLNFTTDVNGKVSVGRNPFSSGLLINTYGFSNMDIIIRVEKNGKVGYKVIEASDFNMEYWRGHTVNANYNYNVNMIDCSNFAGSSCPCAAIAAPIISASGPLIFCEGESVTLSSSISSGNQWFKDGVAISGATGLTLVVTISGNYTAKIISGSDQSLPSNSVAVTVNGVPPTPGITATSSTTFCTGGLVILNSSASNGNQWYKDNQPLSGSTSPSLNVTNAGDYTVRVTQNNCESLFSNLVSVVVNTIPPAPVITAGTATVFCSGGNVTLTSDLVTGNQWFKDGVLINGTTNANLNVTTGGTYVAKQIISGCESVASNAIVVTVNPIPGTPNVTVDAASTFCAGGSVTLTSSASSGNQWYKDGIAISGSIGVTLQVNTSGNYTVKVTVNGCESASSNILLVTVNPIPPGPSITAGTATTFCAGGNVQLTSDAGAGNQWFRDGLAISGATNASYGATQAGVYTVKRIVNNCESPASNAVTVFVTPLPATPSISLTGTQLVSTAPAGNQWYLNGTVIPGATSQNYSPVTSGNYSVQVTLNNCTSALSNVFNYVPTAIPDIDVLPIGIKVIPNPVRDHLVILNSSILPNISIRITDITGKQLLNLRSNSARTEIDMGKYAPGMYVVSIEDRSKKIKGKKLVVKL